MENPFRLIGPRWWGLLFLKGIVLLLLHLALMLGVKQAIPGGVLGTHLQYSFAVLGVDLLLFVAGYFLWLDQRFRCRTCLRRLRMPLATGSFGRATLFAPPRLEWICPYGHGMMSEPGAHLNTPEGAQWVKNDDNFWKAFEDAWKRD